MGLIAAAKTARRRESSLKPGRDWPVNADHSGPAKLRAPMFQSFRWTSGQLDRESRPMELQAASASTRGRLLDRATVPPFLTSPSASVARSLLRSTGGCVHLHQTSPVESPVDGGSAPDRRCRISRSTIALTLSKIPPDHRLYNPGCGPTAGCRGRICATRGADISDPYGQPGPVAPAAIFIPPVEVHLVRDCPEREYCGQPEVPTHGERNTGPAGSSTQPSCNGSARDSVRRLRENSGRSLEEECSLEAHVIVFGRRFWAGRVVVLRVEIGRDTPQTETRPGKPPRAERSRRAR
jgi:hypothetical protein